jgi:hypothetical protein
MGSNTTTSTRCQPASGKAGSALQFFDAPIESWFTANTNTGSTSSSSSDSSILTKLQDSLLSVTDEEMAKLKKQDFSSTTGLFADAPLVVPVEVDETVRQNVNILNNLNNAVKSVCRFVNDTTEIKADADRYDRVIGCESTTFTRRNAAKAHYLWAISHLGEALTFTSVILYNTGDTSSFNFQRASSKLQSASITSVDTVVAQIDELQAAVAAIFDTDNPKSMISKMLYDLSATNGAFDAIVGLPTSVKTQITKILDGIKTTAKNISGTGGEAKALKSRLLDTVTANITKKINEAIGTVAQTDAASVTPEVVKKLDASKQAQVAQLCKSFDSLTKDSPSDKKTAAKPKACP